MVLLYNQRMTSSVEKSVSSFFERTKIKSDATIGVALSGGRDSVALFHALLKNGKKSLQSTSNTEFAVKRA